MYPTVNPILDAIENSTNIKAMSKALLYKNICVAIMHIHAVILKKLKKDLRIAIINHLLII